MSDTEQHPHPISSPTGVPADAVPSRQNLDSQLGPTDRTLLDAISPALLGLIEAEVRRQLNLRGISPESGAAVAEMVTIDGIIPYMPARAKSPSTVNRWRRTGRIPAKKIGGVWYFSPGEVSKALRGEQSARDRVRDLIGTWHQHAPRGQKGGKFRSRFHKK
jgi:hypothetical protein